MSLTAFDRCDLSVALDLRHPLAYLALVPTRALGERLSISIDWLPLAVPPLNAPSEPGPDDDRGIRHRRSRAQAIAREIETYGAAQGLTLRGCYRSPDPSLAHRAWIWLRDRHPERLQPFLSELFSGYWAERLDPTIEKDVIRVIEAAGVDPGPFSSWLETDGPGAERDLASELAANGLNQVPAFVVGDEVFYGRQHLPMIEWMLTGREGRGPI